MAGQECKIAERKYVFDAVVVFGDAKSPQNLGCGGRCVFVGQLANRIGLKPCYFGCSLQRVVINVGGEGFEPHRCAVYEFLVVEV